MSEYCIVLTSVGNIEEAHKIIDSVLKSKLAACMQTINIGSHYIWKGEVCNDNEVLILFKTTWNLYDDLEAKIKGIHSYDTPEIIAIDIEKGYKGYLDWVKEVTHDQID